MKTEAFIKWEQGKSALIAVVVNRELTDLSIVPENSAITPTTGFSEPVCKSIYREIRNPDAAWKRILALNVHDIEYAKAFMSGEFFATRVHSLMAQGEFDKVYANMEPAAKPRVEKPANGNSEAAAPSGKKRGRPAKVPASSGA